jgi:hypothetical protein
MSNLIDLGIPESEPKELEKNYITLIFEDKESRVSWWADTSIEDTRFSIICACDALVDSEFEVLDDRAKQVDFNTINFFKTGSIFFLRKTANSKPTSILLDGRRKLFVEVEPLRHVESQVAIRYMMIGSNLLKHSKEGFPHIRQFQLSSDLKRILWYTKSKSISDSQVAISSISDLIIGQKSENFIRYPLKMLEEFSFSIFYKSSDGEERTLDLTCKDEREFDLWVIGVKALHCHLSNKIICKNELLSHSKSFQEQVHKGNIGSCSKFLFYENGKGDKLNQIKDKKSISEKMNYQPNNKTLEKFIVSRNLSQFEIAKLLVRLCNKIKNLRGEVEGLSAKDEYLTGQKQDGYEMIFAEEAIVDDLDTQKNQMIFLFKQCEENLAFHLKEFLWFSKEFKFNSNFNIHEDDMDEFMKICQELEIHSTTHLVAHQDFDPEEVSTEYLIKELDIELWKIEIDLENVGDIINRFKTPMNQGILDSLKSFLKLFKK